MAALRAVWCELKDCKTPSSGSQSVAESSQQLGLPCLQLSSRMSAGDRHQLVEKFEKNYPGVFSDMTLADIGLQLLHSGRAVQIGPGSFLETLRKEVKPKMQGNIWL